MESIDGYIRRAKERAMKRTVERVDGPGETLNVRWASRGLANAANWIDAYSSSPPAISSIVEAIGGLSSVAILSPVPKGPKRRHDACRYEEATARLCWDGCIS